MADAQFELKIVSPEGVFLQGKASLLELRTVAGQIGVMAGHEPLLTALDLGDLIVHQNGERKVFYAAGGFARVYPDHVLVLTLSIRERVNLQEFEGMVDRVEELMADAADAAQIDAARALARERLAHSQQAGLAAPQAELEHGRIVSQLKRKRPG